MKQKHRVSVNLEVGGYVTVEAESPAEAELLVQKEMDNDESFLIEGGDITSREVITSHEGSL